MILWTETSGNNCFKAQLTKVGNFEIPGTHHYGTNTSFTLFQIAQLTKVENFEIPGTHHHGTNTSFTLFQIAVPEECKLMLPQLFLT